MALTDLIVPIAATGVAAAVTWRVCLRPMRNGQHCAMGSDQDTSADEAAVEERAAEIARLREQVREQSAAARTEHAPL